jgi:hypothetical protein
MQSTELALAAVRGGIDRSAIAAGPLKLLLHTGSSAGDSRAAANYLQISHASRRRVRCGMLLRSPAAASAIFAVTQQARSLFRARNNTGQTLTPEDGAKTGRIILLPRSSLHDRLPPT